ncbi:MULTISPECIES: hypothetical protein [unclassified Pseudomonas]|uniref:hypothetical protein n=1 Tax=unclassified Pseudomonas TaxID=196821 RepID=UPI00111BCF77|nr:MULTISPECIES: hypothetical protein [unclassified Pseudomonas]
MRNIILCMAFLLCTSCAMNHGKPIAHLQYVGVERYLDRGIYQVRFSSDVDVVNLFKSKVSQTLLCSFEGDFDFSAPHSAGRYGEGFIEPEISSAGPVFRADVLFFERKNDTSEKIIEGEVLRSLLVGRESIACKVRINSYSYKIYLSEDMEVPTADLLREIDKF